MSPELRGLSLALAAGLCTMVGGMFVFCVKEVSRTPLAVCMSMSAGVMLYVALIEIIVEARNNIQLGLSDQIGNPEAVAYGIGTACFFSGWVLTSLMDVCVKRCMRTWDLEGVHHKEPKSDHPPFLHDEEAGGKSDAIPSERCTASRRVVSTEDARETLLDVDAPQDADEFSTRLPTGPRPTPSSNSPSPVAHRIELRRVTSSRDRERGQDSTYSPPRPPSGRSEEGLSSRRGRDSLSIKPRKCCVRCIYWDAPTPGSTTVKARDRPGGGRCLRFLWRGEAVARSESEVWDIAHAEEKFQRDQHRFLRTGVFTALALTIHNIPEGVASFTGSLASRKLGVSVAAAIGIHNIPEGFAVSMPLYYGTHSRWKALFYSMITGLAEPLGALLCWAVMDHKRNRITLGLAFGVVAGIMANISIKELLPSALNYDPTNRVTTVCFFIGMAIMAFSLVLFEFGP